MKRIVRSLFAIFAIAVLSGGCQSVGYAHRAPSAGLPSLAAGESGGEEKIRPDAMMIWTARLNLSVWNISNTVVRLAQIAEKRGGYVENMSESCESSASMTLRLPSKIFRETIQDIESVGEVVSKRVDGEDVTEQYVDIQARLKNKIVLRDRLQQLLDKAVNVKDVLAIEAELNRVQSDIDSMEGRIKALRSNVDFTRVEVSLQRKKVLGPLGYLLKGLGWGIKKLFVLRE